MWRVRPLAPARVKGCESHFRNLERCESGFRNTVSPVDPRWTEGWRKRVMSADGSAKETFTASE